MAKRFLDTGFLQQKWIRKLKPEQKIFLIYLMLECDNAGIIDLDMEDAKFWIGKKIGNPLEFLPEGYLIPINDSGKFFQPKFIEWQYPNFPHSKVHQQKQAKEIMIKNGLFDIDNQLITLPKDYLKFTQTLPNSKVIGNDNGNVDDNVNEDINKGFELFWDLYHTSTGRMKTDKDATLAYWLKLTKDERLKAFEMITLYSKSAEKQYLKKARTYLSDKNFNDQFNKTGESEFNDPLGRLDAIVNK